MNNHLITAEELAEELGVPRGTIAQWRWKGQGPRGIKVGKHLRFRREDVDAWIEAQADPVTRKAG
jgi:excisionase family DNA binding protein